MYHGTALTSVWCLSARAQGADGGDHGAAAGVGRRRPLVRLLAAGGRRAAGGRVQPAHHADTHQRAAHLGRHGEHSGDDTAWRAFR